MDIIKDTNILDEIFIHITNEDDDTVIDDFLEALFGKSSVAEEYLSLIHISEPTRRP